MTTLQFRSRGGRARKARRPKLAEGREQKGEVEMLYSNICFFPGELLSASRTPPEGSIFEESRASVSKNGKNFSSGEVV